MSTRRLRSLLLSVLCAAIAAGVAYSIFNQRTGGEVRAAGAGDRVLSAGTRDVGASGLPLPRFVSLKTDVVNVRRGPSNEHEVAWVFRRRGLPVEIIAEFEHWRRIRDSDGEEGWIYQSLLGSKRTAIVEPWKADALIPLRRRPEKTAQAVAMLKSGVIGEVEQCTGQWCELAVSGYEGWIEQLTLFGVYPGEQLNE